MSAEQSVIENQAAFPRTEKCGECGRSFSHSAYIDHLFKNRECMRRYWKDEEKTHIYRLRHRTKPSFPFQTR